MRNKVSNIQISWKLILIIVGIFLALGLCAFAIGVHVESRCYSMEEQINESKSGIDIQLKNRNDSIRELVQVVEQFSQQEQSIVDSVTEARAELNSGDAEAALKTLNIVIENYPQITSGEQYTHLSTTISTCEQQIANYRNNYNQQVKTYRKYIRNPINKMILDWRGYESIEADYLEFDQEELEVIEDMFGNN